MAEDPGWWTDPAFWDDMFDFVFPPEHLALGAEVADRAPRLLGLAPGARVLDLGCGPGRVAVPLARRGFRVTGVDFHAGFLARARDRAAREGARLDLVRGDAAALALAPAFDAVLSVFNSFGYFADPAEDVRVLERAHAALRPGGRLLLEVAHRDGVVRTMHVRERTDGERRWREEPRFDPVTGLLESVWTVEDGRGLRTYRWRSRPYSATEHGALLRAAGFREVRFYGDLDGGPPSIDRYMIVAVAER
jgi:SAM-dependent methyltransferase